MTTFEKEMAARLETLKMERKRTYADAIEAMRDFGEDVERRQARIDARYKDDRGDTVLTRALEKQLDKERKHLEGMVFMVSYMFDVDQAEVIADIEKFTPRMTCEE